MTNVLLTDFPTLSQQETFALDPREVADLQLAGLRQRFEELRPRVRVLDWVASDISVDAINTLDDVVPLCMPHTMYKSYSSRDVESGRFDRLTEWLDGLTAEDLSGVDVGGVDSLESWLEALEAQSRTAAHSVSSGTTGKVSFFPRTTVEADKFIGFILESWSGIPGPTRLSHDARRDRVFSAVPMATGRQSLPRMFDLIRQRCYGGDGGRVSTRSGRVIGTLTCCGSPDGCGRRRRGGKPATSSSRPRCGGCASASRRRWPRRRRIWKRSCVSCSWILPVSAS